MIERKESSSFIAFFKKHSISCIFIAGFAFDVFVLPDVDHFLTIILGTSYILLFSICLFLRELIIKNNKVDNEEKETYRLLTFLISFFSGSSLSYIFTYSIRSSDIGLAAPFLGILFVILISNELVSSHRFRLLFDYMLLIIVSSFYIIFIAPLLTGAFDDKTLFISVLISAVLIYIYTYIFSTFSEFGDMIRPKGNALAFLLPIIILFLALNFLLPPVPFKLQKIIIAAPHFSLVKDQDLFVKIVTIGSDPEVKVRYQEGENLTYTTVYALPDGVTANPKHFWYKKSNDDSFQAVPISATHENKEFEERSLETRIKEEKGEYKVDTRVGRRLIREDTIIIY